MHIADLGPVGTEDGNQIIEAAQTAKGGGAVPVWWRGLGGENPNNFN